MASALLCRVVTLLSWPFFHTVFPYAYLSIIYLFIFSKRNNSTIINPSKVIFTIYITSLSAKVLCCDRCNHPNLFVVVSLRVVTASCSNLRQFLEIEHNQAYFLFIPIQSARVYAWPVLQAAVVPISLVQAKSKSIWRMNSTHSFFATINFPVEVICFTLLKKGTC